VNEGSEGDHGAARERGDGPAQEEHDEKDGRESDPHGEGERQVPRGIPNLTRDLGSFRTGLGWLRYAVRSKLVSMIAQGESDIPARVSGWTTRCQPWLTQSRTSASVDDACEFDMLCTTKAELGVNARRHSARTLPLALLKARGLQLRDGHAFGGGIDGQTLDGMPLANEQTLWVWPLVPNRSHRLHSTGPETFEPHPCISFSRPIARTSRSFGRSDLKSAGAADSYRDFLRIKEKGEKTGLVAEAERRLSALE